MKKRRMESAGMDEVERTLYGSFCASANSISQLYTQAQHHHKLAFQAGQRHSLEKVFEYIQAQHLAGKTSTPLDILNYLKNEMDSLGQAEVAIGQLQNQLMGQSLSLPPFGRAGISTDQQKPTFPSGFNAGFPPG